MTWATAQVQVAAVDQVVVTDDEFDDAYRYDVDLGVDFVDATARVYANGSRLPRGAGYNQWERPAATNIVRINAPLFEDAWVVVDYDTV